jgi:streptogramin lyase
MRTRLAGISLLLSGLAILSPDAAAGPAGQVRGADGTPVAGALVTFEGGRPAYSLSVYTADDGSFRTPALRAAAEDWDAGTWRVRVRRIGWRDRVLALAPGESRLEVVLEPEADAARLAAQLPANRWYQLVLERLEPAEQEELKRQCTFCHQQGSFHTRLRRDPEQWRKLLLLMGRMGGNLTQDLRARLPELLNAAYDPATAIPALTADRYAPDFAPPPSQAARRAVIEEWELGGRASMQHDVVVHPDGRLYSVDMAQDRLYRLDPSAAGAGRETWRLPRGDLPPGGVFAAAGGRLPAASEAHVGPHSIQVAPDGALWITLALGNQLARFDPESERFETRSLDAGYYPHTLRFDGRGRIWYTIAASNHLGFYDPASGEARELRLPARTVAQELALRTLPLVLWIGRYVDLRSRAAESDGFTMPIPYGIDVAPDGSVWFSQLNEHRIGRVDPESFEVELVDTPFKAPRRLRFDSRGRLWIPSFSDGLLARFDPRTREFRSWPLPIDPAGSETPYALNVEPRSDAVWICGTNSDSLIRFDPAEERFTVYPLPTRVTYTREIDFDARGRVWTSNSNTPAWQIEGGMPKVLRLDPEGLRPAGARLAHAAGG